MAIIFLAKNTTSSELLAVLRDIKAHLSFDEDRSALCTGDDAFACLQGRGSPKDYRQPVDLDLQRAGPVVLCGDELAPPQFIAGRKHNEEVAAILLGRRKFIWVLVSGLREYEPNKEYLVDLSGNVNNDFTGGDAETTTSDKQRRIAFLQDVKEFQTAAYWKNLIEQQREARVLTREMSVSSDGRRKRRRLDSGTPVHQRQLFTPRSTPSKAGRNAPILDGIVINGALLDGEEQRKLRRQNERLVVENPARSAISQMARLFAEMWTDACSEGISTIFVGNTKTPFRLSTDAVNMTRMMKDRLDYNEMFKSFVDLSDVMKLSEEHFPTVVEYLQHGEFEPRLISTTTPPCLKGIRSTEQKHSAAIKCAEAFQTASHLQLGDLQMLCLDKLKTLYPLRLETLLFVTFTCMKTTPSDCEAESEYHVWIVDHIAEYYDKLKRERPAELAAIFERSRALEREVKERVAADPGMGKCGLSDDGR